MSNKALNFLKYIVIITIFGNHTIFASGIDKLMKYASPNGFVRKGRKITIFSKKTKVLILVNRTTSTIHR